MHERKQQVILSALKLFKEKGFVATSVQDIIEESNISKGTFYNYFSSKNEFLQAILEYIDQVEFLRRERLLLDGDKTDKKVFIEQVLVRIKMNQEYNLLPMLESIFHSENLQLKGYVKQRYMSDLTWIYQRFIDIYGEQAKPYLNDATIIFHSIVQHLSIVSRALTKDKVNFQELVTFSLRRIDGLIIDMMKTNDSFLTGYTFKSISPAYSVTKKEIILKLNNLLTKEQLHGDLTELLKFLVTEFKGDNIRVPLVESVGRHLRKLALDTEQIEEVNHLLLLLWQFIDKEKAK